MKRIFASLAAVAAMMGCTVSTASVAQAAPARTKIYTLCGYHKKPQVRPHRILLSCGDGNGSYTHLRWEKWGRRHATAFGALTLNDCIPNCALGTLHDYPVRLHTFRPRRVAGHRVFTRSAYVALGQKPGTLPWRGRLVLPHYPLR